MSDFDDFTNKKIVHIKDVCDSIRQQLLVLVEWTKCIPAFVELPIEDQMALLRAHAVEHLLLGLARWSLRYKDVLLLGNNCIINSSNPNNGTPSDVDISSVGRRVLDELVKPLKDVQIDDTEISCLRAIVFFDPREYKSY